METVTKEDIAGWFSEDVEVLKGAKILFAEYYTGNYEGSAFVLFSRHGKLYEVHGSHCSCYGLENQWNEEETSVESLEHHLNGTYGFYEMNNAEIKTAVDKWKTNAAKRKSE